MKQIINWSDINYSTRATLGPPGCQGYISVCSFSYYSLWERTHLLSACSQEWCIHFTSVSTYQNKPMTTIFIFFLVLTAEPVNGWPYPYPQFQRAQVTRLITEMLQDDIAHHSTSPFSSPAHLVKRKDLTWRFCVYYRTLNAITVKDRFPIPTVDELHGAKYKYFSKFHIHIPSFYERIV